MSKDTSVEKRKPRVKGHKSNRQPQRHGSDATDDEESDLSDDSDFSDDSSAKERSYYKRRNRRKDKTKTTRPTRKSRRPVNGQTRRRNLGNSDSEFDTSSRSASDDDSAYTDDEGSLQSGDEKDREIENLRRQLSILQQQQVVHPVLPQPQLGHMPLPLPQSNSFIAGQAAHGSQQLPLAQVINPVSNVPSTMPPGSRHPMPQAGRLPPKKLETVEGRSSNSRRHRRTSHATKAPRKKADPDKPSFRRVDWYWDMTELRFKLRDTADSQSDEDEGDDYVFHVRRTFDPAGRYRQTFVDIKSKLLRECVKDVVGEVKGVTLVEETPKLDPDFLFLYLADLRAHYKHLKNAKPMGDTKRERSKNAKRLETKLQHLKVLLKYLYHDYADTKLRLDALLKNGLITFNLLWAIFKPKSLIYATTYGNTDEPRVFKADTIERHINLNRGEYWYIEGKYLEFDGKNFGYATVGEEIGSFRGSRKITTLPCYPLVYRKDEPQIRAQLIERGRKFVQLSGVHYKSYSGMAYLKGKKQGVIKFNVQQSRMMVDAKTFRRVNPNYLVSPVGKPGDPAPYDDLSDGESNESDYNSDYSYAGGTASKLEVLERTYEDGSADLDKEAVGRDGAGESSCKETPASSGADTGNKSDDSKDGKSSKDEDKVVIPDLTDDEVLLSSPVVLGFAFADKQWLEFKVSGISDIKWNDQAWDSLVLEPETKDLIQALVTSRKNNASKTIDDVIQGKGKGLVSKSRPSPRPC